jgi:uncharacterized protein (TIGR02145 family)
MKKVIFTVLLSFTTIFMSACGGGGGDDFSFIPETIVHNGTTYGTVTSPYTGKVWLDRNLGASQVCTALDDSLCYGDYYQWGRNYDGHQESNSTTTTTQATDINNSGSSFITSVSTNEDWTTLDSNRSLRSANWSKTNGSSVCPTGYRVPTIMELEAETTSASIHVTDNITAFNNFLKLPSAGFRNVLNGFIESKDFYGAVWSSETIDDHYFLDYSTNAETNNGYSPANGFSVRCIKDSALVDTEAPQLTSTSGSYDNNPDSDNTQTIDYASVVSDNITLDANLKVNIVSSNPELTITNTGTSITFTRTDGGVGDSVVIFNFEDENGNVSVNYTQTLLGLDDV